MGTLMVVGVAISFESRLRPRFHARIEHLTNQELQNLRGHLHCILLVSHQEEFADAFPDGYRFELHDGATRISRFQR